MFQVICKEDDSIKIITTATAKEAQQKATQYCRDNSTDTGRTVLAVIEGETKLVAKGVSLVSSKTGASCGLLLSKKDLARLP